jgi:tetratricopeptide (TPR) repeat protein
MNRALVVAGLLVGLAAVAPPAQAQTGTARGKVVDQDGQPVVEAKVLIEYQGGVTRKFETKTNKKGEFTQVGMQPGVYKFTVSKDDYQPVMIEYRISLGDPTQLPEFKMPTRAAALAAAQASDPRAELRADFHKAVALTAAGQYDEAEALYNEILTVAPEIAEVHQNLGFIYAERKDWAKAEAALDRALELKPDSPDIATALARVYQETGRPEKAMQLMNTAAGSNPQDARAQFNRGIFLLNSGDSVEAIEAFEAAIAADPALAEAHYHLGTLMVGQSRIPEAVEHLERYLAMNPDNAQNVATAQGLLKALKK